MTVPSSTPVGYGTWTLVPTRGSSATHPPLGGVFVLGAGVAFVAGGGGLGGYLLFAGGGGEAPSDESSH